MEKIKKSILILDNGEYTYMARELTKYFTDVKYFSRWAQGFPKIGAQMVGDGIEGVERVLSWEDHIEDTDIFFIPDLYFRETANYLISIGKQVWGSGNMETQERDRGLFYDTLKDAGLPVSKITEVRGVDEMLKVLKGMKSAFVKISEYRGLKETWQFIDSRFAEDLVVELSLMLGIYKNSIPIYIQAPVGDIEYGLDMFLSKCKMPSIMPIGIENKDTGYFMKFEPFKNLPQKMREVHEKYLAEVMKTDAKDYTGFLSSEVRVDKDGLHYFSDVTCRAGIPSSCSMLYGCDNFGEIIVKALAGEAVDFKPKYKYVVEIILDTECKDKWNPIYFDDKYKDQIFLSCYAVQDGFTYKCPTNQQHDRFDNFGSVYLGSVCGGGDSIDEAAKNALEAANNIQAFDLKFKEPNLAGIRGLMVETEKLTGFVF